MWLKCAARVENHWVHFRYAHPCSATVILLQSGYILYPFFLHLFLCVCVRERERELSCFIYVWLCDPMYYNPSGSSVHGIFPARILEGVVIPSSRGSSQLRDRTHFFCVSCTAGLFFTAEPLGKPAFIPRPLLTTLYWDCPRSLQSMSIRHINAFAQTLSSASRCCWVWMKVHHDPLCWSVQLPWCISYLLSRMFAQKSLAGLILNIWATGRPSSPLNLNYSLSTGHLPLQHLICVLQVTYHSLKLFIYLLS